MNAATLRRALSEIGRRGGSARSEAKTSAARENGKLGGRPRGPALRCPCGAMTATRAKARAHKCPNA